MGEQAVGPGYYNVPIFTKEQKEAGWKHWHPANACPQGKVLVKFADGSEARIPVPSGAIDWNVDGVGADVVAYREV